MTNYFDALKHTSLCVHYYQYSNVQLLRFFPFLLPEQAPTRENNFYSAINIVQPYFATLLVRVPSFASLA